MKSRTRDRWIAAWYDAARLYAAQFAMLNEDGMVTPKERRCLDRLREQLGISPQQAMRLESG